MRFTIVALVTGTLGDFTWLSSCSECGSSSGLTETEVSTCISQLGSDCAAVAKGTDISTTSCTTSSAGILAFAAVVPTDFKVTGLHINVVNDDGCAIQVSSVKYGDVEQPCLDDASGTAVSNYDVDTSAATAVVISGSDLGKPASGDIVGYSVTINGSDCPNVTLQGATIDVQYGDSTDSTEASADGATADNSSQAADSAQTANSDATDADDTSDVSSTTAAAVEATESGQTASSSATALTAGLAGVLAVALLV